MKSLKTGFAAFLLFLSFPMFAQTNEVEEDEPYRGYQFYAELGGPGVLFSANFDGRFKKGSDLGWGYRGGLGFGVADYYTNDSDYGGVYYSNYETRSYVTIPLGINYIFGKKKSPHSFEIGAGATILTREVSLYNYDDTYNPGYLIGHASFMYRKKPIDGGFTWRIGFTPIIGTGGDISPSIAVGIGYAF